MLFTDKQHIFRSNIRTFFHTYTHLFNDTLICSNIRTLTHIYAPFLTDNTYLFTGT